MERRTFGVVEWMEGEDAGKLSDIRTDTIQRYDDSKMDKNGNPIRPYVAYIEWRRGRKPKGGWPHFKANVLFVCGQLITVFYYHDQ